MASDVNKRFFTIDSNNNLLVQSAEVELGGRKIAFRTEKELAVLAEGWALSRFVDIWNQIPGNTPIKKFTDRKTAIRRIWMFAQSLMSQTQNLSAGPSARRKGNAKTQLLSPAPPTKSEMVLTLLRQAGGASLFDLMAATGWQAHSVRGFISGQLAKKQQLKIRSFKRDGDRVYSVRS
jgi:hypothetical protein